MSTQIVQHKSRDFDVVLNFPSTENTLSWSFTAENDGEIYAVDLVNVASYQIAGAPIALPYTVTAGTSYSVSIVKQTNGLPSTISFNTRRAVNKTVSISVPDLSDVAINNNYMLLANETVLVLNNSNVNVSNYQGTGVWTDSIIRGTVALPDKTSITNFHWNIITHVKYNSLDYVMVIGFCTSRNNDYPFVDVCLINPTSLNVTDLDGNANFSSQIIFTDGSRVLSQSVNIGVSFENFINNFVIITSGNIFFKLDIISRQISTFINTNNPSTLGISTTLRVKGYYDPIGDSYAGRYGLFRQDEASHFSDDVSYNLYDFTTNTKYGFANYFGRIRFRDIKGNKIFTLENSTLGIVATHGCIKNRIVYLVRPTTVGFYEMDSPFRYFHTNLNNYDNTGILDVDYIDNSGDRFVSITNGGRLLFSFIDKSSLTITQAYYDIGQAVMCECNDKIQISI